MAALFRGKFLAGLRALAPQLRWPDHFTLQNLDPLYQKSWRVYLKRPFGGPDQVLSYLANYTHRVAIANSRLRQIDETTGQVHLTYRDYADGAKVKPLALSGIEFIRRFSRHLLPRGFTKIRHYGLLANNRKARAIPKVRLLLHSRAVVKLLLQLARPFEPALPQCERCQRGRMKLIAICTPRGTRRFRARRRPPIEDSS